MDYPRQRERATHSAVGGAWRSGSHTHGQAWRLGEKTKRDVDHCGKPFSVELHTIEQETTLNEQDTQQRIERAKELCAKHRVAIIPYGNSWWIKGSHVDFICTDLAFLKAADLMPQRHYCRGN